jgi:signal peptide peptidase SppA
MPRVTEEKVWAGTEASLHAALDAEEARATRMAAGERMGDKDRETSRLLAIDDAGVATISIKGPLTNDGDADWNEWMGMTGYPEIRDAMISAATDTSVQHIILDIDSGGGAVSGVDDTAKLIRLVHDNVKPVTAFTDGSMYSAAYWLGSSAGEVYASKAAGMGSIGVIATHMERSEMLKEAGIGVTVIRAGKYKALANGVEKLTEEGKAQIQAGVDAAYKIFVGHVAEMRGKSYEFADSVMAQGREFYGQAGADAGLVDGIKSFDQVMSDVKRNFVDPSIKSAYTPGKQTSGLRVEKDNGENGMGMKVRKALSEQDIAALAAGATLEADQALEIGTPDQEDQQAAPAEASVETPAVEDEGTGVGSEANNAATEVDASAGALKFVAEQLKAAQDDLVASKIEASKLKDKLEMLEAVVEPLKDIAAKAVNNMRVALGGSLIDMSASSPAQILAEHVSVSASFASKFKVGGVSATNVEEQVKKPAVGASHMARVNAARYSK